MQLRLGVAAGLRQAADQSHQNVVLLVGGNPGAALPMSMTSRRSSCAGGFGAAVLLPRLFFERKQLLRNGNRAKFWVFVQQGAALL